MESKKKMFISGKLSGTRTFKSDLMAIKEPDNIEKFLLDFCDFKLSKDVLITNKITTITTDEQLDKMIEDLKSIEAVGLYVNETEEKIFVSANKDDNYIIEFDDEMRRILQLFFAKPDTNKYIINSYSSLAWFNKNEIEIRSIFDIPTYLKILTNKADPYKKVSDYLKEYTDYTNTIEDDTEKCIKIASFCLYFGQYLGKQCLDFNLSETAKIINENTDFEITKFNKLNENGGTKIELEFNNNDETFEARVETDLKSFKDKAYGITPLNRIVPKYSKDIKEMLKSAYLEDLTLQTLNNLYINNIPAIFDFEKNRYVIRCKAKNLSSIISVVQAVFSEAYSKLFGKMPRFTIECHVLYD